MDQSKYSQTVTKPAAHFNTLTLPKYPTETVQDVIWVDLTGKQTSYSYQHDPFDSNKTKCTSNETLLSKSQQQNIQAESCWELAS